MKRLLAAALCAVLVAAPAATQTPFTGLVMPPRTLLGNTGAQSDFGQAVSIDAVSSSINITSIAGYAESAWTPTITAASGGGATYTTQVGTYERIGRTLIARFTLVTSSLGTLAGAVSIGGLPIASSASTSNDNGSCMFARWSGATLDANYTHVAGVIAPNATSAGIFESSNAAGSPSVQMAATQWSAASTIAGVCHYHT